MFLSRGSSMPLIYCVVVTVPYPTVIFILILILTVILIFILILILTLFALIATILQTFLIRQSAAEGEKDCEDVLSGDDAPPVCVSSESFLEKRGRGGEFGHSNLA